MQASIFLQSMWIGLSIAAPVGPIGLLVIQRTLRHGATVGLATGFGAAVADASYGAVGAFGVSALIAVLQGARVPLALLGGAFLLWLAWHTWHAAPATVGAQVGSGPGLWPSFAGTFFLTLSNPATILSFVAIFGALAGQGVPATPWSMVGGVLIGSGLWWLMLCVAVGALRTRFDARAQRWVGRVSALMLAGFALWQWALCLAAPGRIT
jgi:threonine/homoserine/homoserine lactone efflux protein